MKASGIVKALCTNVNDIVCSVLSKKILQWVIVCFVAHEAHEIAQPCRHTTSETFQAFKRLCDIIKFGMLQVRENEILRRNWSGSSAPLRSCAPWREHW